MVGDVFNFISSASWLMRSKHFAISASNTYFGLSLIALYICPIASWRNPAYRFIRLAPTQESTILREDDKLTRSRWPLFEPLDWCFPPGFMGVLTGQRRICQPRILCLFGSSANSLISLVSQSRWLYTSSKSANHRFLLEGNQLRLLVFFFTSFFPASSFDG